MSPTYSPTAYIFQGKITGNHSGLLYHSENIYELSQRNMTYNSPYRLPDNSSKYCVTCLLAWSDIDASIDVPGCKQNNHTFFNLTGEKSHFYNCTQNNPNGW